jgi:hypothetical protein
VVRIRGVADLIYPARGAERVVSVIETFILEFIVVETNTKIREFSGMLLRDAREIIAREAREHTRIGNLASVEAFLVFYSLAFAVLPPSEGTEGGAETLALFSTETLPI